MNKELARSLWTMGGAHALGAEAVVLHAIGWANEIRADDANKAVFNGKYSASIYLLLGYGFELLLKSAFIHLGGDPETLGQKGIGHNLETALEKAEGLGFCSNAPNLREIVLLLKEPHLRHHFRYGGLNDFPVPADVSHVVASLQHLASELQALLYPDDEEPAQSSTLSK